MSRIRTAFLAAAVAALASVAMATAAQAHEYRVGGSPLVGSETLKERTESSVTQELAGTPFGVATHINCSTVEEKGGEISAPTGGKADLEFSGCEVTKPANCTVTEPIKVEVNTELVGPAPGVEVKFLPKNEGVFTTIALKGEKCSIKEPFNVTGTQTCALPGGETEATEHEIACASAGSALKAGGKAATFKGGVKKLEISTGGNWSAV